MKDMFLPAVFVLLVGCSVFAQQTVALKDAELRALESNRELAAARIRIEEARSRLQQAGVRPNPEFEMEGRFDSLFNNEGERGVSAGLVQPFSISGRIAAQKGVAEADLVRTIAEVTELERRVVGAVRKTFTEFVAVTEQVALQKQLIAVNDELIAATKAALTRGEVSEKDVNALLIAQQLTGQRLNVLATQRRSRILELNKLMGLPPENEFATSETLEMLSAPDAAQASLEQVLAHRPDFAAAQLDVALAGAGQRLAKAERYEDWRVGVGYDSDKSVIDGGTAQGVDRFVALKLSIPLPIFDKKKGRILETHSAEERARATVEALWLQISHELADASNRVASFAALLKSYQGGVLKKADENVKLVEDGYRKAQVGIAEVIQSRQQFNELKSSYIDTLRDYREAVIDLQIASGEFPRTVPSKKEPRCACCWK